MDSAITGMDGWWLVTIVNAIVVLASYKDLTTQLGYEQALNDSKSRFIATAPGSQSNTAHE